MGFGMGMAAYSLGLQRQQQFEATRKQLQRFMGAPAGSNVASRSLSKEQGRDLFLHYWVNEVISTERWPECDANGNVIWPKPTDRVRLKLKIAGVPFIPNNPQASKWTETYPLDLRNIAMVVRFTQYLKANWGVSAIYWGGLGIGGGRTDKADTHTEGLAMDFHGAVTSSGHYDVLRDWGNQPVRASIGGGNNGKWPASATNMSYRLAPDPLDKDDKDVPWSAASFFQDIYEFLTTQARHDSPESTPRIGERSGILHPDTPWPWLRDGHQNHFHFEVALK